MRTFVKLKEMLSTNKDLAYKLAQLERKIEKHDGEIKLIFDAIRQLMIPSEKKSTVCTMGNLLYKYGKVNGRREGMNDFCK